MSFCQEDDLLQCLPLCQIASMLIQKMRRRIWKESNEVSEIHYWFETRNTIPNAPRGHEDELLSGGRFIAVFAALSNREYVDSEDGADGFGKRATR
jgi:hypothetical protein